MSIEKLTAQIKEEAKNLRGLKESSDYSPFLNLLDDLEMNPNVAVDDYKEWHLAVHLLSYILIWDDLNAKFLWKRVASGLKKSDKTKPVYEIIKYMIRREFDKIIPKLSAIWKSSLGDETLEILCEKAIQTSRFHLARTITKYYKTIALKEVALILAFSEKEAEQFLTDKGWKKDGDFIVTPEKIEIPNHEFKALLTGQFDQTTKTISFLETI